MSGSLRRSLSESKDLVLVTVEARDLIESAGEQVGALPPALLQLGHASMSALMVQALNDPGEEESVELQWRVDGPLGNLNAHSKAFAKCRASISNSQFMTDSLQVSLGSGLFQCRKEKGGVLSSGIVTSTGFVNQDLESYFQQSEQRRCAMGLCLQFEMNEGAGDARPFRVSRALGYLVHLLPNEDGVSDSRMLAMDQHLRQLGPLSQWVLDEGSSQATLTMARFLSGSLKAIELHESPLEWFCGCSRDKVLNALTLLTSQEQEHLFDEERDKTVEVRCEYCGKQYIVPREEIAG